MPKPDVPLCPVTMNDIVVAVDDWFVAMLMLVICELVTFPLMFSSTVAPLSVVVEIVVCTLVGEGDAVIAGLGKEVGFGVAVGVYKSAGVAISIGDGDGLAVGADVAVGVGRGLGVKVCTSRVSGYVVLSEKIN